MIRCSHRRPTGARNESGTRRAIAHNPMLDRSGPRLVHRANSRGGQSRVLQTGLGTSVREAVSHRTSERQLAVYDPKSGKYTFVDTCYSTHHLQFAEDANDTLWTSGGHEVMGWLDTKKFDSTGDAAASQGWAPFVLDTNGNGKLDPGSNPVNPRSQARPAAGGRASTPSCRIRPTAASGARSHFDIRAPSFASIRERRLSEIYNVPAARLRRTRRRHRPQRRGVGLVGERTSGGIRSAQMQGSAQRADARRAITAPKAGAFIACRDPAS